VTSVWGSFKVLRVGAYRRWLLSSIAANVGLQVFVTVYYWTVLQRTGSATAVGLCFGSLILSAMVFVVPAGVFADRVEPRRIIVFGQGAIACVAALATFLASRHAIDLPVGLLLGFMFGAADVFWEVPALVYCGRCVERPLMASAIALSTLYPAIGRIVGGVTAGWLLTAMGSAFAFGVVAVILGFSMLGSLTLARLDPTSTGTRSMRRMDVLPWFSRAPAALALVGLGASAAVFAYSYLALGPVIAQRLLHTGANGLGLLTSGGGLGVLAAALVTDPIGRVLGRGRTIAFSLVCASLSVLGLGLSTSVAISVFLTAVIACALSIYSATNNVLLQALAPLPMRGRVLSAFYFVFWGLLPAGSTLAGLLSDWFGVRAVLLLMSALTMVAIITVSILYPPSLRLDLDNDGFPNHSA
jgi:MFS family permease